MASNDLDRCVGEPVAQLVSAQFHPSRGPSTFVGMSADSPPYEASCQLGADVAVSRVIDDVSPGDFVVLFTGCVVPRAMAPGSDCSIGAVGLARARMVGLRAYHHGAPISTTPCVTRASGMILRGAPPMRSFAPLRSAFRITLCSEFSCSPSWGYSGKGRVRA